MAFPSQHGAVPLKSGDLVQDASPSNDSLQYRSMLKVIDNGLGATDMDRLKFLCHDLGVSEHQRSVMKRGIDLFIALEMLDLLKSDDVSLLVALMKAISRYDLAKKVMAWSSKEGSLGQKLTPYSQLLLRVSDSLSRDERGQLRFYLSGGDSPLPVAAMEECTTILQVFLLMEKYGLIGPDDLSHLRRIMASIGNSSVVKEIDKYTASSSSTSSSTPVSFQLHHMVPGHTHPQPQQSYNPHRHYSLQQQYELQQTQLHEQQYPQQQNYNPQQQNYNPQQHYNPQRHYSLQQQQQLYQPQLHQHRQQQPSTKQHQEELAMQKQQLLLKQASLNQQQPRAAAAFTTTATAAMEQPSTAASSRERRPAWYYEAVEKYGVSHANELWEKIQSTPSEELRERMRHLRISTGSAEHAVKTEVKVEPSEEQEEEAVQSPGPGPEPAEQSTAIDRTQSTLTTETSQGGNAVVSSKRIVPAQTATVTPHPTQDAATVKLPRYNMSRLPRGLCIIFNAEEFPNQPYLETRTGTEKDVEKLYNAFLNRLLFQVCVKKNPTSSDFISCLQEIQQMDHSEFDCFACVILTHGCLGKVYGTDGQTVDIDALTSLFRGEYCPSLVNKPKLFFIQACQGKDIQSPVDIRQDTTPTIPNQADILVSLSTVPGFTSNRSISQGTWYISSLCQVLTTYYKTVDLLSMLTMVNDMLSSGVDKQFMKQIGHPSHTLRKQIFFNQGLSDSG